MNFPTTKKTAKLPFAAGGRTQNIHEKTTKYRGDLGLVDWGIHSERATVGWGAVSGFGFQVSGGFRFHAWASLKPETQ
jgi:hypothetical protein